MVCTLNGCAQQGNQARRNCSCKLAESVSVRVNGLQSNCMQERDLTFEFQAIRPDMLCTAYENNRMCIEVLRRAAK